MFFFVSFLGLCIPLFPFLIAFCIVLFPFTPSKSRARPIWDIGADMDIRERENSDILADILYIISTECGCEVLVTKTCNRGRISYIYLYHGLGEYSIQIGCLVSVQK